MVILSDKNEIANKQKPERCSRIVWLLISQLGFVALACDYIFYDIPFDIRQVGIMGWQSISVKPPELTTQKANQSAMSSKTYLVVGDIGLTCDYIFYDIPFDIRQTEIATRVAIRQAGMVQTKEL